MLAATRAIVATGSYRAERLRARVDRAAGRGRSRRHRQPDARRPRSDRARRRLDQVLRRLSLGPLPGSHPTFSLDEMKLARRDGAQRRRAGRRAYEHGRRHAARHRWPASRRSSTATTARPKSSRLMAAQHVALCPTLAAGDAIAQYGGRKKGQQPEPASITRKRASFKAALDAGVTILSGSDVGVFPHGDNAREIEMMVELRHAADRRAEERDVDRRARAADGQPDRPGEDGSVRRSRRLATAIRPKTSRRCGVSSS